MAHSGSAKGASVRLRPRRETSDLRSSDISNPLLLLVAHWTSATSAGCCSSQAPPLSHAQQRLTELLAEAHENRTDATTRCRCKTPRGCRPLPPQPAAAPPSQPPAQEARSALSSPCFTEAAALIWLALASAALWFCCSHCAHCPTCKPGGGGGARCQNAGCGPVGAVRCARPCLCQGSKGGSERACPAISSTVDLLLPTADICGAGGGALRSGLLLCPALWRRAARARPAGAQEAARPKARAAAASGTAATPGRGAGVLRSWRAGSKRGCCSTLH